MASPRAPTIRANVLAGLLAELVRMGVDADALLRDHVEGVEALRNPYQEVPLARYAALFEAAAQAAGDPLLGARIGQRFQPDDLGPLGVVFVASPNLRTALNRLGALLQAWQGGTSMSLEVGAGAAEWAYRIEDPAIWPRRQDAEFTLSSTCGFIRNLLGRDWAPIEVHFEHPAGGSDSGSRGRRAMAAIFRAPVLYEQGQNRLVIDPADLDRPVAGAGRAIAPYLEQHLRDLIGATGGQEAVSAQAARLIARRIGRQRLDLRSLAAELGLSARTLQRRLAEERTSLRALVRAQRLELAEPLLSGGAAPVTSIAHAMGYADPTVFSRAFRSWKGRSPRDFRQGR
jgi:AraC-like DNA-binding protein